MVAHGYGPSTGEMEDPKDDPSLSGSLRLPGQPAYPN